jgi:gliding motility-associated lipoprotein GldH
MIRQLRQQTKQFVSICILLFVLWGCNKNIVYTKYQSFVNAEWLAKDKAIFDVEIIDTQSLNTIFLMVRHGDSYPYSNLYVFVTTKYPDGKIIGDTMELILSNEKGEWQGSGSGDIYDVKIPIKKNTLFKQAGKYQFTFEQGMRVNPLTQILDFGMEIKRGE